jgi:hypothetical protein
MAALSLTACAPISWDKPGATQAEFNADNYACNAQARALSPGGGYAEGSVGFVVAATLVSAVATAADRASIYHDCMTAHGYTPHQAVATAALPSPPTGATPAASLPVTRMASTSAPLAPIPLYVPPPTALPVGRVVLFPVTIYNPYYPPSTYVDVQ